MSVRDAYRRWAPQYDSQENRTRDLEAISLRRTFDGRQLGDVLEIGCGTGKNTAWIVTRATSVLGIDLSDEMLAQALAKVTDPKASFVQADVTQPWSFVGERRFDTAVCSLVLEHIEDLSWVFFQLSSTLRTGGVAYVGELHPFKQYTGSKARFETDSGTEVVKCFTHHISDFVDAATEHNFHLSSVREVFDEDDRSGLPRILTLTFTLAAGS